MLLRNSLAVMVALSLVLLASHAATAQNRDKEVMHQGKVVSAGDGKLTMTDMDGKNEHTHMVPTTAKIKCDGKECKLEDIKAGYTVKVYVTDDTNKTVLRVDATRKDTR